MYLREFEELINVNPDLYSGHYPKELRIFETEGIMTTPSHASYVRCGPANVPIADSRFFFFFGYRAIEVDEYG